MSPSLALIRIISLRLITHLYSEHLVDQDHYLDWLIVSFRDTDLDALPMWLLVMQIHQQDVLQHRQRGCRLVEALLKHIDEVSRRCGSYGHAARLKQPIGISTNQPRIVRHSLQETRQASQDHHAFSPCMPHPSNLLEQV